MQRTPIEAICEAEIEIICDCGTFNGSTWIDKDAATKIVMALEAAGFAIIRKAD